MQLTSSPVFSVKGQGNRGQTLFSAVLFGVSLWHLSSKTLLFSQINGGLDVLRRPCNFRLCGQCQDTNPSLNPSFFLSLINHPITFIRALYCETVSYFSLLPGRRRPVKASQEYRPIRRRHYHCPIGPGYVVRFPWQPPVS